jgi:hypothetical protein
MDLDVQVPWFLRFLWKLAEGCDDIKYFVYSTINRTKGNPTKASDTLN